MNTQANTQRQRSTWLAKELKKAYHAARRGKTSKPEVEICCGEI